VPGVRFFELPNPHRSAQGDGHLHATFLVAEAPASRMLMSYRGGLPETLLVCPSGLTDDDTSEVLHKPSRPAFRSPAISPTLASFFLGIEHVLFCASTSQMVVAVVSPATESVPHLQKALNVGGRDGVWPDTSMTLFGDILSQASDRVGRPPCRDDPRSGENDTFIGRAPLRKPGV